MNKTTTDTTDKLGDRLAGILFYLDSPWKAVVLSDILAVVITTLITILFDSFSWGGIGIALICATIISYFISHLLMMYRQMISDKNHQLELINAQLEESNRDLTAFSHRVAHDLRTPITNIIGYSQLAYDSIQKSGYPDMEPLVDMLKKSQQTGMNMSKIIDEILLLAGLGTAEIEIQPLDMKQIITNVTEQLNPTILETGASVTIPNEWPDAMGYGPWIEAVWTNYLTNGLKYGGHPPEIELGSEQKNGMIRYWVKDNGPGIKQGDQDTIFDEFTRLGISPTVVGHGIGLALVRRILEKLGGEYGVESDEGKGSLFFFTLPTLRNRAEKFGFGRGAE
jgi:signal transduction histidine kinase